jgi:hypothetical protein
MPFFRGLPFHVPRPYLDRRGMQSDIRGDLHPGFGAGRIWTSNDYDALTIG